MQSLRKVNAAGQTNSTYIMKLFSRSIFTWESRLKNCQGSRISTELPRSTFFQCKKSVNLYKQGPENRCLYGTLNSGFTSTIFSLSSGQGKCGVAVIRVSGTRVKEIMNHMIPEGVSLQPRKAVLSKILDPETKEPIDKGLVLNFPGPHSFTGEDCLEFQVHGGPAVISSLLTALHKIPDCKQAEPGEFTKRAFVNGKLDLTEVEGLGDLIHAETEVQRKQALRQMDGDLSQLYSHWRKSVIKCVADLEAFIDFSEDQHIEEDITHRVCTMVQKLKEEIRCHVNDKRQGERLREGVHVTILGEPNVGKSSLLNTICQRPAAIVTEIAGTTRDIIETAINLDGYPVLLSDTAGLRHTQDIVEKEGVKRAVTRAKKSDIRVFMFDNIRHIQADGHSFKPNSIELRKQILTFLKRFIKDDQKFVNDNLSKGSRAEMETSVGVTKGTTCDKDSGNISLCNSDDETDDITVEFDNTIIVLNKIDLLPKDLVQSVSKHTKKTDNPTIYDKILDMGDPDVSFDGRLQRETEYRNVGFSGDASLNSRVDKERSIRNNNTTFNSSSHHLDNDMTSHSQHYQGDMDCNVIRGRMMNSHHNASLSVCCISCVTSEGLENFIDVLRDKVANMCGNPLIGHPSITQTRHRSHLVKCLENLDQFDHMISMNDIVLASEYLRRALREIGKITGNISSEEILDVIFRDFCIGK